MNQVLCQDSNKCLFKKQSQFFCSSRFGDFGNLYFNHVLEYVCLEKICFYHKRSKLKILYRRFCLYVKVSGLMGHGQVPDMDLNTPSE